MKPVNFVAAACAVCLMVGAGSASAQTWTGGYAAVTAGSGMLKKNTNETVTFDTNLDGTFGDTVRTGAGVDAFGPGFCGGLAVNATAASGCTDDKTDGAKFGGRAGYDKQVSSFVVGGLVDFSTDDVLDHATAFSVTPAFYSFTRKLDYSVGFRARAGYAMPRVLVYATAGPAWANIGQSFSSSNTANAFVAVNQEADVDDEGFANERVWGYQAGAGVEFNLGAKWTLAGEYLYAQYDNREVSTIRSTRGTAAATNPFVLVNPDGTDLQRTENLKTNAITVGFGYRF